MTARLGLLDDLRDFCTITPTARLHVRPRVDATPMPCCTCCRFCTSRDEGDDYSESAQLSILILGAYSQARVAPAASTYSRLLWRPQSLPLTILNEERGSPRSRPDIRWGRRPGYRDTVSVAAFDLHEHATQHHQRKPRSHMYRTRPVCTPYKSRAAHLELLHRCRPLAHVARMRDTHHMWS
jgi:hypothetical protein